jgi:hypothetical protein
LYGRPPWLPLGRENAEQEKGGAHGGTPVQVFRILLIETILTDYELGAFGSRMNPNEAGLESRLLV